MLLLEDKLPVPRVLFSYPYAFLSSGYLHRRGSNQLHSFRTKSFARPPTPKNYLTKVKNEFVFYLWYASVLAMVVGMTRLEISAEYLPIVSPPINHNIPAGRSSKRRQHGCADAATDRHSWIRHGRFNAGAVSTRNMGDGGGATSDGRGGRAGVRGGSKHC